MSDAKAATAPEILLWIRNYIAKFKGTSIERVPEHASIDDLGVDSSESVNMLVELEEWLDLPNELDPEMLFEGGTVADIAEQVAGVVSEQSIGR